MSNTIGDSIVEQLAPGDRNLAQTRFNAMPRGIQQGLRKMFKRQSSLDNPVNLTLFNAASAVANRIVIRDGL